MKTYTVELFINEHSHGVFYLWSDALIQAEYLINESDIDPESTYEIAVRKIEP